MALNFGIEPPAWMQDRMSWIRGMGERGMDQLVQGAQLAMNLENNKLNQASQLLSMQQQEQNLELGKFKMLQASQGSTEVHNWLKEGNGDPAWYVDHPIMTPNPEAQRIATDLQARASQSLVVQKRVQDVALFNKKLATLTPENRAMVQQISPGPNGTISPAQWQSLNLAEQTDQAAAENKAKLAEIEALQRGDTVTTTVRDGGVVTQTYRPPSASSQPVVPQEMTLSDGSRIVSNPKTGSFKIIAKTGEQKDMTSKQLMDITKALKEDRPDDPLVKKIEDFVLSQAAEQVERTSTTPAPAAPSNKVLKYNPATGRIE